MTIFYDGIARIYCTQMVPLWERETVSQIDGQPEFRPRGVQEKTSCSGLILPSLRSWQKNKQWNSRHNEM